MLAKGVVCLYKDLKVDKSMIAHIKEVLKVVLSLKVYEKLVLVVASFNEKKL